MTMGRFLNRFAVTMHRIFYGVFSSELRLTGGTGKLSSQNDHLREYLDYYTGLTDPPEYAVLVSGLWGCGKTWFIKDYFLKRDPERSNHLYVSLYGMCSTSEIELAFFEQLHPVLSSKGMSIAAKIAGRAINLGASILSSPELLKDGEESAILSHFTNTEGRTLVFDDLERCSLKIIDLLGYINRYVEHDGYKCIIVANEDEISKPDEILRKEYLRIKEKLIGKTIKIVPEFDNAANVFISRIPEQETRDFLTRNIEILRDIYSASRLDNLRKIRHALMDFARIYRELDPIHADSEQITQRLYAQHLAYSLEIQSSTLKSSEIGAVKTAYIESRIRPNAFDSDDEIESKRAQTIPEKYPSAELEFPLVSGEFWKRFYDYGTVDGAVLNDSIAGSHFYYDDNTPDWRRLLDLWSLTNDEFKQLIESVRANFTNLKYEEAGIVQHVAGIFMSLSDSNLIPESKSDTAQTARSHIDRLRESGDLVRNVDEFGRISDGSSFANIQFWGIKIPEFIELCQYVHRSTAEALVAALPAAGTELMEEMRSDIGLYVRRLVLSNSVDNKYYNKPILAHIKPEVFVDSIFATPRGDWRAVASVLLKRYEHSAIAETLVDELPWLQKVEELLVESLESLRGTLDEYRIESLVTNYIREAVKRLTRFSKEDECSDQMGETAIPPEAPPD